MKNIILTMCIVACVSMFSSCSNDDSYPDNATDKYQTENSASLLRPIIRNEPTITGNIIGSITPAIPAIVMATNSKGIHYYGMVYDSGQFQISALWADTYMVSIIPNKPSPLQPIIVPNVVVRAGETTDIGALSFYVEQ